MDVIEKVSPRFWKDPDYIWKIILSALIADQVDVVLLLLNHRSELPIPWQWYVLINTREFSPGLVERIFELTRYPKALSYAGELFDVDPNIRTIPIEIFQYIAKIQVPDATIAFQRAYEVLGKDPMMTYSVWMKLKTPNLFIENEMINAITTVSPYARKPQYLIERKTSPLEKERIIKEATIEKPVYLPGGSLEIYRRKLSQYQIEQTQIRLGLEDSIELFRVAGPVNVASNADLTEKRVCAQYGGCRMLLCDCFDEDWFLEHCQVCLRKIRSARWALRRPIETGSWKGCYCSPACLLLEVESPIEEYSFNLVWDKINQNKIYFD